MTILKEFENDEQLAIPELNIEIEDTDGNMDLQNELEITLDTNFSDDLEECPEEEQSAEPSEESEDVQDLADTEGDEPTDGADEEEKVKPRKRINWRKSLLIYAHDILYLLAILIVSSLFLRVVVVSGTSMTNTLKDGDYLLVLSNVFYRNPEQGDIIVASKNSFDDGKPIVKRVIATEGQTVDIDFDMGIVYVDGIALDEPYTKTPTTLWEGVSFPLVVEEDCVFVLGDNRNGSRDSRHPDIGQIHKKEIIGKVLFIFLPGTNGTDIYGNPNEPRDFRRIGVPD